MKKIQWKVLAYDEYKEEKFTYIHPIEITIPDAPSERVALERAKDIVKRKFYTTRGAHMYEDLSEEQGRVIGAAMKEAMKDNDE